MMNHIVFQAYGSDSNLQECLFALLSFSAVHPTVPADTILHIYTDRQDWFARQQIGLPLQYHALDQNRLQDWRGKINFVHRVKIALLQDLAQEVQGNILYLDSDICFLQPVNPLLQRIAAGELFMHIAEGRLEEEPNPVIRKLHRFLQSHPYTDRSGNTGTIPAATEMWNAGVLGFRTTQQELLAGVLHFTDTIHPVFPRHVVEQFAFSYFMSRAGAIHSAATTILHYWNFKEFRQYLASFVSYMDGKSWEEKVRLSALLQVPALLQEKLSFYMNRSIADKIAGKHYQPRIPDWSKMEGQL
jgi:hypothetical protein